MITITNAFSPLTRTLFPVLDDAVLRFLHEDNKRIEPEWYAPIIPMVLVNGAAGIGTGWSTNIPCYNPRDLVARVRVLMHDDRAEIEPIHPWYRNFRGRIQAVGGGRYACFGVLSILEEDTVEITELPIETFTGPYKEDVMELMLNGNEKQPPQIQDYKEYNTDVTVKFVVRLTPAKVAELEAAGTLYSTFKLHTAINTSSMVLFDAAGVLRRFNTAEDILREFVVTRRGLYLKRKQYMLGHLKAMSDRLSNQARFILAKVNGEIVMENKKKKVIVARLVEMKFDPDPVKVWKEEQRKKELAEGGADDEEEEQQQPDEGGESDADEGTAGLCGCDAFTSHRLQPPPSRRPSWSGACRTTTTWCRWRCCGCPRRRWPSC